MRTSTLLAIAGALLLAVPAAPVSAEQAAAPPGTGRALAGRIDLGELHTCAVLDAGIVRCWGFGFNGQLGHGGRDSIGDDAGETPGGFGPVDVGAGRTAVAIAAGGLHTCGLLDNGTVRCWGFGANGVLGYGNTDSIGDDAGETPGGFGPVDLGPGRTASAISVGSVHTCALLDDGTVRCWGNGLSGRLGLGDQASIGDDETPAGFGPVDLGPGRTATAIAAGDAHTCALLDDGAVRCWGIGAFGRLGLGAEDSVGDDPGETPGDFGPVDLGDGRTATAISAGDDHTCAVLDNGTVRCWGRGEFGQLGYGNTDDIGDEPGESPGDVGPVDLGDGRTATAITAGRAHTCALLDDGTVRCWGRGVFGKLGSGSENDIGDGETPGSTAPLDLGAGRHATAIAAGADHTCAVLDDGTVRCWGRGVLGQLGYGNTDDIGDDAGETPGTVGPVAVGGLVSANPVVVPEPPAVAEGDGFTPVPPVRVLDTRAGLGAPGPVGAESILALSVPGVPSEATAVVLNVTVTEPDRAGFLTVWPCGPPRPLASNVNFAAAESRPNLVVATRGIDGRVCFGGNATTHVVADLAGWFAPFDGTNDRYNPLAPVRLVDTRTATPLTPSAPLTVKVIGGPVPAGATAVMLNVTAVEPGAAGFLTVWPCDQPQPVASNVNYRAGQIVPNAVAVKATSAGTVCVATYAVTDVVIDRVGWFGATGALYRPADPVRVLDTRIGLGAPPGRVAAESTLTLTVPSLPAGATGVIVNVTATEAGGDGFVTVWPCAQPRPLASTLNVTTDQPGAPNLAAVALSPGHRICLSGNVDTHLVADVTGAFISMP